MPEFWLTTERLALRHFTPGDIDWMAELYSDPDVTLHLGGVRSRAQVEEMFATRVLDYYQANPGYGIWMTVERRTGEPVGFHLLNNIQGDTIIQVGFSLKKSAWNKSYGTEMGIAVLRHGFKDLALPKICGMASLPNVASQRVLSKIGLERKGERFFSHPAYASAGALAWFEGERENWTASFG